jgi:type I restriction enzyme S subunit
METTVTKGINNRAYEVYDFGGDFVGDIPDYWKVCRLKFLSSIYNGDSLNEKQKDKYQSVNPSDIPYVSSKDINVEDSSVDYDNGIRIPKTESSFKVAPKGSSLICIEGGSAGKKIAFTSNNVCFVNKLACVKANSSVHPKYVFYSLKASPFQTQFGMSLTGLIGGVSLSNLASFQLSNPPLQEQLAIVEFLDRKTAQIDRAIKQKERLIELLQEHRQILIHRAITRGLTAEVPMKESGVEWIGKIPEHWSVTRLKYILNERNERSVDGNEQLLMMSQIHGLVVRADHHEKAEVAKSSEGNKIVHPGDLVFNKLKAHLGVFFKSTLDFKGIVSPDYAVYYSNSIIPDLKILELLFKQPVYIKQFVCRATGIVEGLIRLYTGDLFDISVPIAPPDEQMKILEFAKDIDRKTNQICSSTLDEIERLREYKSTLIDASVTGKIKVV